MDSIRNEVNAVATSVGGASAQTDEHHESLRSVR